MKGVYVCGMIGEGIYCFVEERKVIVECWVKVVDGKLDVILYIGVLSIVDIINLIEYVEILDIFVIFVIGLCFFKLGSVDDLVEYCV